MLDKHRIRCTASLNLAVLERYPEIRDAMVARDWDFMSHGIYNTDFLHGMSVEQEREFYRDCKEMLLRQTGKELKGMFGPGGSGTEDTPDLMAEAGLIYHCEWWHDDQPFPIKVREGKLISVPYSIDINDAVVLANGFESDYFCQMIKDQFDELYAEGAESGRVMCIALHPFLTGQPHRIEHLDEALEYILSHDGVWRTTADAIADYYYRRYYDPMLEHLEQVKAQAVG